MAAPTPSRTRLVCCRGWFCGSGWARPAGRRFCPCRSAYRRLPCEPLRSRISSRWLSASVEPLAVTGGLFRCSGNPRSLSAAGAAGGLTIRRSSAALRLLASPPSLACAAPGGGSRSHPGASAAACPTTQQTPTPQGVRGWFFMRCNGCLCLRFRPPGRLPGIYHFSNKHPRCFTVYTSICSDFPGQKGTNCHELPRNATLCHIVPRNGIQEVSGSIPLISTKGPENYLFLGPLCLFYG